MVRVPCGAIESLVAEGFQEIDQVTLGCRIHRKVDILGGSAEALRGQREGTHQGIPKAALVQEVGCGVQDPGEVHGESPPIAGFAFPDLSRPENAAENRAASSQSRSDQAGVRQWPL